MGEIPRDTLRPPTVDRGHEQTDVSIRPLAMFLTGLTVSLIITGGLMAWLFDLFESQAARNDPAPPPLTDPDANTPGPLLQVSPRQDLEVLRQREERLLHTTEWVNREAGIVRIPIDRAIELIADGGLPEWPPAKIGATQQGEEPDQAPLEPAARAPEGSGQTTPVEGGAEP